MTDGKIDILVAEDSTVIRMLLVQLLESDPQIRVIGAVSDGQAALDFVRARKPDVVLMDIHMPNLNGFEATRSIMETNPVPIVICSATSNTKDVVIAFQAMEAGAIACIEKPLGRANGNFDELAAHLLETLKLMAEVKVVRRSARPRPEPPPDVRPAIRLVDPGAIRVVGIGASTGGPQTLQLILADLPGNFPIPLLIVQHIAAGFLSGLVEWLSKTTGLPVHIATQGILPQSGHVYLAPDSFQMGVTADGRIALTREDAESHLRPAVSYLFRSLADQFGPGALGVLLTGMGQDGAKELKAMKDRGAITIAQDQESSIIHGMPGVAIALGGATHVLAADKIASALIAFVMHPMAKGS